ncbi:MAG: PAS domain S-box protein [Desulfobacteraceae bacterium]|nr:MAG: PAS domain S-box protein [Desulfobacteraceae bacterium]
MKKLRILNLEDNPNDSDLIQELLEDGGIECEITRVETGEEFISACDKSGFDIILSDYSLPSFDGLSALKIANEKCSDIPFIFVSGKMGEDIAVESLKNGAVDYILKSNFKRLAASVKRALKDAELRTTRRQAEKALQESEERYRMLFENSMDAIILSVPDGKILATNPETCRMLRYNENELRDLYRNDVVDVTDPRLIPALEERSRTGKFKGELSLIRKDRTMFPCEISSVIFHDSDGAERVSMIIRDITERKQKEESQRKFINGMVHAMVLAVEARDPYTAGHQRRVAQLAAAIAKEMDLPALKIEGIERAAAIHDIGKISVPADLLSKPTVLSEIEYQMVQIHPEEGYKIFKEIEFPWPIALIILQHHERLDGSGYPNRLRGDEILTETLVVSVADVVEAISSHRPYRPAYGINFAMDEISKNRGILYDPDAVDACLKLFNKKGFKFQ